MRFFVDSGIVAVLDVEDELSREFELALALELDLEPALEAIDEVMELRLIECEDAEVDADFDVLI